VWTTRTGKWQALGVPNKSRVSLTQLPLSATRCVVGSSSFIGRSSSTPLEWRFTCSDPCFQLGLKERAACSRAQQCASFQTNFLQNHRRAIAHDQVEFRLLDVNAYCRRSGNHGLIEGYSNIRTTATLFPIMCMGNQPPTSSFICGFARLAVSVHLLSGIQRVGRCDPTPWIWIDAI
jgi:hypothetical protein